MRQIGFVDKELTECSLSSIQQINHKIGGLLRTLFNYGRIEISVSGTNGSLKVENIPNPYDFQQEVLRVAKGDIFLEDSGDEDDDEKN